MNIYLKITIKSVNEGYLYTFGAPLGVTGTGAHTMSPRTLEKLSTSIDNIKVIEQERVVLQFIMTNPLLYGIRPPSGDFASSTPAVTVQVDISTHSGLPPHQLYGKTWVVSSIQVLSSPIINAVSV